MKTWNVGYTSPHDDFTETQFDAENMADLFNLFIGYANENLFLDKDLVVNYIEEVDD